jgi:uncharacterized SAM-binding protein YcdF (DUF218 family)
MFIIYAFPLTQRIFNAGNLFGMCVGGAFIVIGVLFEKIIQLWKLGIGKVIIIIFILTALAFSIIFISTMIKLCTYNKNSATNENTIIVLGCRVRGVKPSLALQKRCLVAIEYLKNHPSAVAILSGGQGADEKISEAKCMYNIMIENQIDKRRLFIEDKSTSTDENIIFSKKIIQENNLDNKIAIVTSEYHQLRANMICKKNGFSHIKTISAKTSKYALPTFYTREIFGVFAQILKEAVSNK